MNLTFQTINPRRGQIDQRLNSGLWGDVSQNVMVKESWRFSETKTKETSSGRGQEKETSSSAQRLEDQGGLLDSCPHLVRSDLFKVGTMVAI